MIDIDFERTDFGVIKISGIEIKYEEDENIQKRMLMLKKECGNDYKKRITRRKGSIIQ